MPALFEPIPKEFVSKTVFYEYKTPVVETLDALIKNCAAIVVRNGEYCGMVEDRSLFRAHGLKSLSFPRNFPIGKLLRKVPMLNQTTSIGKMVNYFHELGIKAMPYQEGTKITGIVRRERVLSTVMSLHLLSKNKVADVMTTPIIAIDENASVAHATEVMETNKIARIVVLDAATRLSGLITERDIVSTFAKPQERLPAKKDVKVSLPNSTPIKSVMKTYVYTVNSDEPAENVIKQFLEKKVSSLVVLRNKRPVGIITVRDILEAAAVVTSRTQSKVIISGLDDNTREYEEDIQAGVISTIEKVSRFAKLEVNYVSLNIKRSKERNYEMKARLALQNGGTIFAHTDGYSLELTLSALLRNMLKRVKEKKELIVSTRKGMDRYYGE